MQDKNAFNLQLQMHKYCFEIWILKCQILIYEIIKKKWKGILNVKLMLQVGGSKSLLISELLRLNPIIQMVDSGTKHNFAQRHKTVLWLCLEKKLSAK